MLNKGNSSDGSALATGKGPIGGLSSEKPGSSSWKSSAKRDERWCPYCKKSSHTKDTCFKLHGRDKVLARFGGFKGSQQRQVNQTVSDLVIEGEEVSAPPSGEAIPALSKAEMDRLRTLLDSMSKPSGTCSLTMTGKNLSSVSFNVSSTVTEDLWIIDSGATDHMTPYPSYFFTYSKLSGKHHITIASGSHVPVSGCGTISLQPSLPLHNVLHVPHLSNNLISIHKLTRDLNCTVTFFPSHCVFQDLTTGRTIGVAKEQGGLYVLHHTHGSTNQTVSTSSHKTGSDSAASQIWLHHKRLGHPPFSLLRSLFPQLFKRTYLPSKEMSPASKSKSKDKKAGKEAQKSAAKPSGSGNAVAGIPASAYNPLLGTFHTLEMSPTFSTSPIHSNGRFRTIDETDEHPVGSLVAGVEYDSVSNNGSWSGESEDHKEKTSNPPVRLEAVPGADNDKREKIRQKNERKHQRQKERRAQELHDRCSGYLMSRKLETLAQQLVAMGFSHERATVALILNEGRVEESVAWLFEGGEEADNHKDKNIGEGNLKIDISEELAWIADLETRYSCSKQEVERAVVVCEGDLDKAAETLRELKLDPPSAPTKPEETGDPPTINNGKQSGVVSQGHRLQTKPILSPNQPKKDEKDFNYTKAAVMIGGSSESSNRNLQPLKRIQPKSEWAKPQQAAIPADKRWPSAGSNPSVSYSLASPLQVLPTPAKTEASYMAAGGDYKNLQPGAAREPVIVMQRPQSVNAKQVPAASTSSSPPGVAASWYPTNSVEAVRANGFMSHTPSTRSLGSNYVSSNHIYHQLQYQPQQQFVAGSSNSDLQATNRGNSIWNRTGASPTLAAASSLGLFSGLGSAGTSGATSPVDWSTGGSMQFDYTNIDWSLDRGLSPPRSNALWLGLSPFTKSSAHIYGSNASGVVAQPSIRSLPSNGSIVPLPGLQDGGVSSAENSTAGSREWSSPFEGKDLFSLPRQFVSSPSL